MHTLVDSSALLDIVTRDARWLKWSQDRVAQLIDQGGRVCINQIICAEIAAGFNTRIALDASLACIEHDKINLPWESASAAIALRAYRSRGGSKTTLLPDFPIGAHAQVSGLKLLTRDPVRMRTYFPSIELICPGSDDPA